MPALKPAPKAGSAAARPPWPLALTLYWIAWAVLSWPWLSGAVTIPWDAKAHFYPQLQFLAQSIHRGEWPFWTPNIYAGWPNIARYLGWFSMGLFGLVLGVYLVRLVRQLRQRPV